jgi:competence protein ComEA
MIKKILAAMLALFAAVAFAAVDVNKATQAELEAVKGIGPAIAGKILDERKKASFKDWSDMVERVKGVGEGNAAKFSAEGLTVNGAAFAGAPAKPAKPDTAVAKEVKPMAAAADKKPADKATAAPMAATPAAPAATKADAKPAAAATAAPAAPAMDKKAAAMNEKEDQKTAKAAAADEARKAKADKAAAKKDAKAAKEGKPAAAAETSASAAKK